MPGILRYSLIFSLITITAAASLKVDWHLAMAGMTVFLIAYLSKGMRRHVSSSPSPKRYSNSSDRVSQR